MKTAARFDMRLRDAIAAAAIAFLLMFGGATGALSQLVWTLQSKIGSFDASGDIVFVNSRSDLTDPRFPDRRREVAEALDRLADTNVAKVYIDLVFERPSEADADNALRAAMQRLGNRLYLVQSYETGLNGIGRFHATMPRLGDGIQQVGKANYFSYLGYTWNAPYSMAELGNPLVSLPASMAGVTSNRGGDFPINYSFRLSSIPMIDLGEITPEEGETSAIDRTLDGRIVLIGSSDLSARNTKNIPGHVDVPKSVLQIYAAETLKAGLSRQISGYLVMAICVFAVGLSLTRPLKRWAVPILAVPVAGIPVVVVIASLAGVRIDVTLGLAFLAIYFIMQANRKWRSRQNLVDPHTMLPTFAALEADRSIARTQPTIIVGKIHRLDDVKRTLPERAHAEYVNRIVERLRLNASDQTFYIGNGQYLAWCIPDRDLRQIRDHLEGLRALLSAPLRVGDGLVDASMTFSIDTSPSPSTAKRLASAISAVEQTTEAHNPIAATRIESDEDLLWSISLQARIDAAMENGEIYLVYQPKVSIATKDIVGVEALVRWDDPKRGMIAPDLFIRQCESAGRMLHLTRHVLREACSAGMSFAAHGRRLPVAVNISATLLNDRAIVLALHEVLAETGFNPSDLTLEITETYRISSFDIAAEILAELTALGPKISMDDFGVGAASFEALLRLPFGELKIDRLFVSRIHDDIKARGIVKSALRLGKDLRITAVAEGVEDDATLQMLNELGCRVAQGFGLYRPMREKNILELQTDGDSARRQA
ncbi:MAG TPA: EAL domain-containing protein [Croceibacterium sp.]|nr:EAL domain-containing protein [Croceibacterium sp.]